MAISLSCLNVIIIIKKRLCKDVQPGFWISPEVLQRSLWSLEVVAVGATVREPTIHLCGVFALLLHHRGLFPPYAPLAPAFLCYHFSVLCLFICQAAWRLPHHCAGTAGFIKHLTSSQYLMVNLNQGAAGLHSRNWPFPSTAFLACAMTGSVFLIIKIINTSYAEVKKNTWKCWHPK